MNFGKLLELVALTLTSQLILFLSLLLITLRSTSSMPSVFSAEPRTEPIVIENVTRFGFNFDAASLIDCAHFIFGDIASLAMLWTSSKELDWRFSFYGILFLLPFIFILFVKFCLMLCNTPTYKNFE